MALVLYLLSALSVASASTVEGRFFLILDPGASTPSNGQIRNDVNTALSQCFSYKNADGSPMEVEGESRSCASAIYPGITTTVVTQAAPEGAYQDWFGCEHNCPSGDDPEADPVNCYPAKGPCGPTETLQYRQVTFVINSVYADGARAKSVGQNSGMMTEGLLALMQSAASARSHAHSSYPGRVYNYEITNIDSTASTKCNLPLAIDAGPEVATANEATNDWRGVQEDEGLSAGAIFGIVFASLVVVGFVGIIAHHKYAKGGSLPAHQRQDDIQTYA